MKYQKPVKRSAVRGLWSTENTPWFRFGPNRWYHRQTIRQIIGVCPMDILIKIGAVLLLLAGAIYPMFAIFGLMNRLNRKGAPLPSPAQMMVRMLLIATVPLAGILGGFAGLSPSVWNSNVLRWVILMAAAASAVGFIVLAVLVRADRAATKQETAVQVENE